MHIFKTPEGLHRHLQVIRQNGIRIGFVPTMGALHLGHRSLMEKCKHENGHCVASIFVNPTQFNNATDLEKYPQPIGKDIEMLLDIGVDTLFLPSVEAMYPNEQSKKMDYSLGFLGSTLEASARPGHFDGVALIVKKLLEVVEPHTLYMGQKDYQQYLVVKQLVADFKLPVDVVRCDIVREADGLAMSSRNIRLDKGARENAKQLSAALFYLKENAGSQPLAQLLEAAKRMLNDNGEIAVEYFEIRDSETLRPLENLASAPSKVALIAATVGGVHLLDNIIIS
ncbi:MAG: pantoate--beta-alanine ligase [Chitinophagales bacterium]|nr:pantoate--beta-alanine ligase [Chitinophagales bacterium]